MRAEIDVRGWLEKNRKQVKAKLTQTKANSQEQVCPGTDWGRGDPIKSYFLSSVPLECCGQWLWVGVRLQTWCLLIPPSSSSQPPFGGPGLAGQHLRGLGAETCSVQAPGNKHASSEGLSLLSVSSQPAQLSLTWGNGRQQTKRALSSLRAVEGSESSII